MDKPKYKVWFIRRNAQGKIIGAGVIDTIYVRKRWAYKYALKTYGKSRPAFEWTVSIENPFKLEVEEC